MSNHKILPMPERMAYAPIGGTFDFHRAEHEHSVAVELRKVLIDYAFTEEGTLEQVMDVLKAVDASGWKP